MKPLDPAKISLQGRHLIEASAGTGKTYTLTSLYIRLLVEKRLSPENILVVTYTEAACQELRERIRLRLAEALAILAGDQSDDTFLVSLFAKQKNKEGSKRLGYRILLAQQSIDLASIYTIHGFCMRVLQDWAFECSYPLAIFETPTAMPVQKRAAPQ